MISLKCHAGRRSTLARVLDFGRPSFFTTCLWRGRISTPLLEEDMKVTYEHVIDAPVEKVLAAYADDAFYVEKARNSGAIDVQILEREEMPGGRLRKKARITEPSRIPSFLRKNDHDTYDDDNVLDTNARIMTWKVTPTIMADKFFLSGSVEFHPKGDKTRVVFHSQLEVKIPLVGGKAEKIGLEKTEEEVERQAQFIRQWMSKA